MLKLNWKIWLAVMLGITVATAGLYVLLFAQEAYTAARWVYSIGAVAGDAWLLFGLFRWRRTPWVRRVNGFVLVAIGFGLPIILFQAIGWETGWKTTGYMFLGVLGFLAGVNLIRLLLRPGLPVLGVARTMLEEALRMGVALIFIITLLAVLPLMPIVFGSEDRVTYMVQRFLTYSVFVVSVLLSLMTALLAARSVSLEFSSKQAHMTLTKPLARWQYLLGKWLGIMLLNAVLVAVAGVAIYGFTMAIARNPALNDLDRYAVDREVLTARLARTPDPVDTTWDQMIANVLLEHQQRDPERYGWPGDPTGALPESVRQEVLADAVSRFYTIDGGAEKTYRFTGLASAAEAGARSIEEAKKILREQAGLTADEAEQYVLFVLGRPSELTQEAIGKVTPQVADAFRREMEREAIQLVITVDISPEPDDQFVQIITEINNQPWPRRRTPDGPVLARSVPIESPYEMSIPASMIPADGVVDVTVFVPPTRHDGVPQPFVQLNPKDAQPEMYYRVGSFEGNLARSMVVVWLKLGFLAMLGLAAGALMSFPVAALLVLVVYVAAAASGYISESLNQYAAVPRDAGAWDLITGTVSAFFDKLFAGEVYEALRILIRLLAEGFMLLVPSFGDYATAEPLSTGRVISNTLVLNATVWIGVVWTGVVGAIGLVLFNRKEIARVTV